MATATAQLRLSSPRVQVIMGDPDDPASWQVHEVQTVGRDTVAAETLFGVQKLGRPVDHPVRSLVAMSYYAMLRTGRYQGSFEAFEADYIEIAPVGEDIATPTEPAPAPG